MKKILEKIKNRKKLNKQIGKLTFGVDIKRCDECEYRNTDQSKWKYELINWLLSEKYISVDETSCNMTEDDERAFKWELSRNCFINKVIKHIEEME